MGSPVLGFLPCLALRCEFGSVTQCDTHTDRNLNMINNFFNLSSMIHIANVNDAVDDNIRIGDDAGAPIYFPPGPIRIEGKNSFFPLMTNKNEKVSRIGSSPNIHLP